MKKVYLIGHGNLELTEFLNLLKDKKIDTLIDVRSVPYSQYVPQFNKDNIKKQLETENIEYVYGGEALGGKRQEGFDKYMQSDLFKQAISQLKEFVETRNAAIMCSETDHTKCHRRFIGSELLTGGFSVENISPKGNKQIEQRTLTGI